MAVKSIVGPWSFFSVLFLDPIQSVRGGVDRIVLIQDRDKWRVLVNTVMNLWVP
jgi:hypothetical protein